MPESSTRSRGKSVSNEHEAYHIMVLEEGKYGYQFTNDSRFKNYIQYLRNQHPLLKLFLASDHHPQTFLQRLMEFWSVYSVMFFMLLLLNAFFFKEGENPVSEVRDWLFNIANDEAGTEGDFDSHLESFLRAFVTYMVVSPYSLLVRSAYSCLCCRKHNCCVDLLTGFGSLLLFVTSCVGGCLLCASFYLIHVISEGDTEGTKATVTDCFEEFSYTLVMDWGFFCVGNAVSYMVASYRGCFCFPQLHWFGGARLPPAPICPCLQSCCCETMRAMFSMGGNSYDDDRDEWYKDGLRVEGDCEFALSNFQHVEAVLDANGVKHLQMMNTNKAIRNGTGSAVV